MTVAVCADEVRWQVHSHRPSSRTLIHGGHAGQHCLLNLVSVDSGRGVVPFFKLCPILRRS